MLSISEFLLASLGSAIARIFITSWPLLISWFIPHATTPQGPSYSKELSTDCLLSRRAACGYARHVEAANAGSVLKEPFRFSLFVAALRRASDPSLRRAWSLSAAAYGDDPTLYQGRVRAADLIVEAGFQQGVTRVILQDQIPRNLKHANRLYSDPVSPSMLEPPSSKAGLSIWLAKGPVPSVPNVNDICSLTLMS